MSSAVAATRMSPRPRSLLALLLAVCLFQVSNGAVEREGLAKSTAVTNAAGLLDALRQALDALDRLRELLEAERPPPEVLALELFMQLVSNAVGPEAAARLNCVLDAVIDEPELIEVALDAAESIRLVVQLYSQRERELRACSELGSGLLPSVAAALQRSCALNVQATTGVALNSEYARMMLAVTRLQLSLTPALRCALAASE